MPSDLMTLEDVQLELGITAQELWSLRQNNPSFPKPVRNAAGIHFRRLHVDQWRLLQRMTPNAE